MSLAITEAELKKLEQVNPAAALEVKSLLGVKQALYDVLGSYPLDNVLPYAYGIEFTQRVALQVPALGSRQGSIKITADAAFVACDIRGASTGDFLSFLRVDNSDRQLMNIAVNSNALVGTGERPAVLRKPLLLPANTTISLDVTDISGQPNDVYFYFHGFKVYQRRTVA